MVLEYLGQRMLCRYTCVQFSNSKPLLLQHRLMLYTDWLGWKPADLHRIHNNLASKLQSSPEINSTCASSFFFSFLFRRRREKLQAHLKESRSLKNYTANSLDAKMRPPNTNLQMHEVTTAGFFFPSKRRCLLVKDAHVHTPGKQHSCV